eukprot:g71195.t1
MFHFLVLRGDCTWFPERPRRFLNEKEESKLKKLKLEVLLLQQEVHVPKQKRYPVRSDLREVLEKEARVEDLLMTEAKVTTDLDMNYF